MISVRITTEVASPSGRVTGSVGAVGLVEPKDWPAGASEVYVRLEGRKNRVLAPCASLSKVRFGIWDAYGHVFLETDQKGEPLLFDDPYLAKQAIGGDVPEFVVAEFISGPYNPPTALDSDPIPTVAALLALMGTP